MRGVIGFAFALPLCIHIGCTFDPIGSLWLWWFWSLWCSICICTTFFISIVELGSSSFFYYNDRICPHWLYFWVPLTNLMVTGWTLENYRILSMLFPIFISLLQIAFTFLRFDCNSGEVSLPWHCEEKCNRNCDENSVSLILTMWCLLLKVVALDFGFNMWFWYPIELPCLLWNQTLLVVFCEDTAEKGQTRVFIFLWVVWTDGKVWLTSHMTYQTCIFLTYSKLGSAHWLGWLWEHC